VRREGWSGLRRILAVRLDNAGDVVMLGPAVRAMAASSPDARLTLLASPAGARAAALLPWVSEVIEHRASWQDASGALPHDPAREQALVADLAARSFDAAVVFTSFSQSPWPPAYACYLAGIPLRAAQVRDFGGSLLTHAVKALPDCVHQVDRNLHLVESLGIPAGGSDLEIRIPDSARDSVDQVLRGAGISPGAPFVAVAPGASCPARRYDPQRLATVVSSLARRTGLPMLLVGHPRERESLTAIKAAARTRRAIVPARDLSLEELAALVARARLLIGNNSGPMHLADAVRCPMVILYSGTDLEEQWQPRTAPSRLLRRPTPCDPCYRFECPFHMECLDIPPAEVVEACESLLERTAHRLDPERRRTLVRGAAPLARLLSLGTEGAEP
jgi:ADP-heptose:LPS heptosyltransferase